VVSIILVSTTSDEGTGHRTSITTHSAVSIPQRRARAYRDSVYHAAVEMNSGAEALNRLQVCISSQAETYDPVPYNQQHHQSVSSSTPLQMSSKISNSPIFTDHTIHQLCPHIYKVALSKPFYTACTDKLQVTNFPRQT